MPLAFNPFNIPRGLLDWLNKASEEDRQHHSEVFAKRAHAAHAVLKTVENLDAAHAKYQDGRIWESRETLIELARDLHDYDPTSD